MTISDLSLPISDATAKTYALVFDGGLASRMAEVWKLHGSTNCVPSPRQMSDGRWMLCADILTEIGPGGLLHAMWENVDQAVVMSQVAVMPLEDATALLPPEPTLP